MAIVGNQTVLNKSPGTWLPGSSTSHASGVGTNGAIRSAFFKWADWVKFNAADQSGATVYVDMVRTAAKAPAYYDSGVWALPIVAGEMAAWPSGVGTVSADLVPSYPIDAAIAGSGSIAATADLVISMGASLLGSGSLSATITGRLNATADLTGTSSVSGSMLVLAALSANVTGSGSISATISAIASMEADIVSTGDVLTTANVGAAVWSALASANNLPGTMGEKLNSAGSAGDPWSTVLPGSYSGSQAGALFYQGYQLARNRVVTNPSTGVMTVYADDNATALFTANVYNDASGSVPYDGTAGINRKDRFT